MRAAVLGAVNEGLRIEELEDPEPRAGEVALDVAACGVCHTDLHVMKGEVAFPTPCVLGHEVAGTIATLGPGVEGLEVGQRVACSFIMPCGTCRHCVRGHEDLCEVFFSYNRLRGVLYDGETRLRRPDGTPISMYSMGGLAERCVVPATDVFPVPDELALTDAAILGCSVFTGVGAVRNAADLRPGETVAIVAVGGVGTNLVQLASAFGARQVIAIDVVDSKLDLARRLGATHTINSTEEDAVERVRELTGGRGVDVAFEALGHAATVETAMQITDDGGRVVLVGIAAVGTTAAMDITRVVRRKLEVRGSYGGRARTDMPLVLDLVARGKVSTDQLITRRVGLEQADEAYRALARGEIVGRAVVEM